MISFNNIPDSVRTPGAYTEIDNSRALKGLVANPHKALIIGQKHNTATGATGTAVKDTLYAISRDNLADGYFGVGSNLARMCNIFKKNNPNTELFALALSGDGTAKASAAIFFSIFLSHNAGVVSTDGEVVNLMINGSKITLTLTSGWSVGLVNSNIKTLINANSNLPVTADTTATSALVLQAVNSGVIGNYLDFRFNYYDGQSYPTCFRATSGASVLYTGFAGGTGSGSLTDAWAVIEAEQYQHIVQPYIDSANLTALETELASRFKPLIDKQGHGYVGTRGTNASCTTEGNARNSPHNIIIGAYNSPTDPAEWGAALGAVCAWNLNNDPARPLHTLQLQGVLPPPIQSRWSREERDVLLYDGIATFTVDSSGNVLIERAITTYQRNALGVPDPSYLDIETLATLNEIRYQYKVRMISRFIVTRKKLADDTFPAQPGSNITRPKDVKQEAVALFTLLRDKGLIENLDDFITNLIVERNATDRNRVDVLLPPDLVNQFRVLAGIIQFIL